MTSSSKHRVAVTGIGVVANCGIGVVDFWDGLLAGKQAGDGNVYGLDPQLHANLTKREARRIDRFSLYAMAAASEAAEMAGYVADPTNHRVGAMVGSSVGGVTVWEESVAIRLNLGPDDVPILTVPKAMPNAAVGHVSILLGLTGPCECVVTACASATHSISRSAHMIADGRADAMFAGGSDATLTPTPVAAFRNIGAHSPSDLSRPFDLHRDGFVMSEGAGILFLERWDLAVARGATILAEIGGGASTSDAGHITAPAEDRKSTVAAIRLAVEDAGLVPEDITYVNAHGTATPLNDRLESASIYDVLGGNVPVTSIKGVTGHPIGAAGAVEAVSVILSMKHGLIPPTVGYETPDPDVAAIDIVAGEARQWTPGPTLSNSFGFGGHNATLIIKPAP